MNNGRLSRLRFNFGFLLEANLGTSRTYELDYPEIWVADDLTLSPLKGEFTATRTSEGVYLGGNFTSTLKQECVRCLGDAFVSIDIPLDELYFYPEQEAPPGAYTFIGDTGFIDLSDLIRETSFLAVPMRPICRPDCLGLCMECGQNLNEKDCGCTPDEIDPRLAELRQFLE
jgi:uncharacterized protein